MNRQEIEEVCLKVMSNHPVMVLWHSEGLDVFPFLLGEVLYLTKKKADPKVAEDIFRAFLKKELLDFHMKPVTIEVSNGNETKGK